MSQEPHKLSFTPFFTCTNCVNFPASFVGLGQKIQGVVMICEPIDDFDITFELSSLQIKYGNLTFKPQQVTIPANGTVSGEFTLTVGKDFKHPSISVHADSTSPGLHLNGVLTIQEGP